MRMTPAVILIGVLSLLATIALTMVYWPYVQQDTTMVEIEFAASCIPLV